MTEIKPGALERLGINKEFIWGYIAVALFMAGDGIETNFLALYLTDIGLGVHKATLVITWYGITVAIGAVLAGVFSAWRGPRFAMWAGGMIWLIFEVTFLAWALPSNNYSLILLTYSLRGFGYPLFAFGFMIWVNAATPVATRSSAMGWYWAAFSAGFPTIGAILASIMLPHFGEYLTLWASLVVVAIGFTMGITGVREKTGYKGLDENNEGAFRQLTKTFTSLYVYPKLSVALVMRIINTTPQIASFVYLPFFFTKVIGFSVAEYLSIIFVVYTVCIFACPVMGIVSDRFGWRNTLTLVGGIGCGVATLLTYYGPLMVGKNLVACMILCAVYGFTLPGYMSLTTIMSTLKGSTKDDGTALGLYALGAGISVFVGPAIVSSFMSSLGTEGLVWIFAGMYFLNAVLARTLWTEYDPGNKAPLNPARELRS
ncbi:MFS transporter [Raoultella sp. DY2415]|uniref:MFS transporter n=1 Tax=Raoultella sp. DY2415 TaxID=2993656 RepID=UPI002250EF24|nr:MFS transporter [Raoultella sp. DY2415]HBY9440022.1 MFS transporter [Klebsiella pneumoniae]HEO9805085.1 MFS transporter [Klebsiella pneumoniae subsp. pneumoniae]